MNPGVTRAAFLGLLLFFRLAFWLVKEKKKKGIKEQTYFHHTNLSQALKVLKIVLQRALCRLSEYAATRTWRLKRCRKVGYSGG